MANPQFPVGLMPTASSYGFSGPSGSMRTDIAGGMGRYALEFDRSSQFFDITMLLEPYEFLVWETFWIRKVKRGVITFDMPLDSGYGVQAHACNVMPGSYKAGRTGGIAWSVALQVEAVSQAFELSDAQVDDMFAVHDVYGVGVPALLMRLAAFANRDTNVLDF